MGGRGGTAGFAAKRQDGSLSGQITQQNAKLKTLSDKMEALVQYARPGRDYNRAKAEEYYKVGRQWRSAREDLNKLLDKQAAVRKADTQTQQAFVNGYGEATKRKITNQTYERAQKRLEKAVKKNMGWNSR